MNWILNSKILGPIKKLTLFSLLFLQTYYSRPKKEYYFEKKKKPDHTLPLMEYPMVTGGSGGVGGMCPGQRVIFFYDCFGTPGNCTASPGGRITRRPPRLRTTF